MKTTKHLQKSMAKNREKEALYKQTALSKQALYTALYTTALK